MRTYPLQYICSQSFPRPWNSSDRDELGGSSHTRRMEAESRSTSDGASASTLVPCCPLLPCSTRPPWSSDHLILRRALGTQQRRARRLVAHTEDGGGEQRRERRCIRIVSRALLPAPALFHVARGPVRPRPPPRPSPSPRNSTATSSEARRTHGGRRRRAGARGTVRPHSPSCSAVCPCPPRLSLRRVAFPSVLALSEHNSETGGCVGGRYAADASAFDGCICSRMGHPTDASVELRLLDCGGRHDALLTEHLLSKTKAAYDGSLRYDGSLGRSLMLSLALLHMKAELRSIIVRRSVMHVRARFKRSLGPRYLAICIARALCQLTIKEPQGIG